jgi:TonB family protein
MPANTRKMRLFISTIGAVGIHAMVYASLSHLAVIPDLPPVGYSDIHTKLVSADQAEVGADSIEKIESTKTSINDATGDSGQVKNNRQENNSQASYHTTNHLRGIVRSELSRYLRYPPVARRNGWEGSVVISMVITEEGQINGIHLVQSSGYDVLDRATITAIRQVRTIKKIAGLLAGNTTSITLPVQFRLTRISNGTPII